MPASDGWLAVTLARDEDVLAIPAWLEVDVSRRDPWGTVAEVVSRGGAAELVARAALLGLPVSRCGEVNAFPGEPSSAVVTRHGAAIDDLVVVDLSSLWAGPLCSQIMLLAGARVIKVESLQRPDGARRGPQRFFDQLHAGKQSVALDLSDAAGLRTLHRLLRAADVVIESSRPRALEQMSIDRECIRGAGKLRVWTSITGYGRSPAARDRVAFGDDAAVAGALVVRDDRGPMFCGDAIADPLAGLAATVQTLIALDSPIGTFVDIALAEVAARFRGDAHGRGEASSSAAGDAYLAGRLPVSEPRTRPYRGRAPTLGADTTTVVAELT